MSMGAPFLRRAYLVASVVRTCTSQTSIVVGGCALAKVARWWCAREASDSRMFQGRLLDGPGSHFLDAE